MKIGVELISDFSVPYHKDQRVSLCIQRDGVPCRASAGADTFAEGGFTLPDARIAATGRAFCHDGTPGQSEEPEAAAILAEAGDGGFQGLTLAIDTNAPLPCAALKTDYCLYIRTRARAWLVPLMLLTIHNTKHGVFDVELADLDYMPPLGEPGWRERTRRLSVV